MCAGHANVYVLNHHPETLKLNEKYRNKKAPSDEELKEA
jgi:hypothetical protein